ncbi:MAG: DNA-binding response regulator [Eubacterium sp.]|jgi:two-component system response regulator YesN|nr:DNA-binding response regulator [Eubacterium sp.]
MYKLLIVDDEDRIRNGIKSMIENAMPDTFNIMDARDGREGLELIEKENPGLVITDIKMPDMDGLEMLQKVSEAAKYKSKPIFLILSGYDNFDYAKRAIKYGVMEYLLKPVRREELIESLQKIIKLIDEESRKQELEIDIKIENNQSRNILKENYLRTLIEKDNIDYQELSEQLSQVGVRFPEKFMTAITVDYKHVYAEFKEGFDELDRFAIRNIVEELMGYYFSSYQVFFDSMKRLVMLINSESIEYLSEIVSKVHGNMQDNLKKYLNTQIFVAVGGPATDTQGTRLSYYNAVKALNNKVLGNIGTIYFCNEVKPARTYENTGFYCTVLFERLTGEVELCNKSNIINLIDEYFAKMDFRSRDISVLEDFYSKFCTYFYRVFVNKSQEFHTFFEVKDNSFNEFQQFWSINQLNIYLKRYLIKICDFITGLKSGSPSRKIIERVIEYVNENYYREINLNTIADHFDKNNSYLSVLFKKETGKNFIDYLIHVRIQKAKNLLEQTGLKIPEIARNVGYPNEKYFFMAFKKVVGKSPQQYRDSII